MVLLNFTGAMNFTCLKPVRSPSVSAVADQNSVRFNMPPASVSVRAPWAMFSPYMPVFANSWSR